MQIIKYKKIFLTLSSVLVLASIAFIIFWGLPLSIDFTGGSLVELQYTNQRPEIETLKELAEPVVGEASIQPSGEDKFLIKFRDVNEETHQELLATLRTDSDFIENRFESIGPVVGEEIKNKAIKALIIAIALIILYIAWAFRKVSKPISSWRYGLVAIVALVHDIIIPTGVVAVVGKFGNIEVDVFFITALLTILGFSVHDTIVVFDRIRENLRLHVSDDFNEVANQSIREVISRSINTSLTLLFVLLAVLFLGGESTKNLIFVLVLGVLSGTYSSIFVASPLLTLRRGSRRVVKNS